MLIKEYIQEKEKLVKGQLRYKLTTVDTFKDGLLRVNYKTLHEKKVLQQYNGEEWVELPTFFENIQV